MSPKETALYEAGRRDLEKDDKLQELQVARETREHLQALETEHAQLERRREQLDGEIAALEKTLQEPARQLLGVEK